MATGSGGTQPEDDRRENPMSTDAIVILKDEHAEIRRAFRVFEKTHATETARRGEWAETIIELLTKHSYIENQVMYPRVLALAPELEPDVLESYEEHHVADVLVSELDGMEPYDERFGAKMKVLMENVEHHMTEEEDEWFPKVRDALGRKPLRGIGHDLLRAREVAPTRPAKPGGLAKAVKAVFD
jgi:hemerythrin superfamily protein